LHAGLASYISAARTDLVFLCGPAMKSLWTALPAKNRGAYAEKSAELAPELLRCLRKGDVVLVKGSFGSRMSVIIEALRARETAPAA
jgi:UDP-N-acetylmuramoyl-tripeptide--D-alanyl-D-alanine ligase